MNLDNMSKGKKVNVILLMLLPLILGILALVYLKYTWSFTAPDGTRLSPVENKPLFTGILLFALGYFFFLGMMFSENILQAVNKRRFMRRD